MTEREVIELMSGSGSAEEWNANCDTIKASCDGYPPFWFHAIIMSGLLIKTSEKWSS